MHIWEDNNTKVVDWVPYVFQKCSKPTGIKSIYGDDVEKITFQTYQEYKEYCKNNIVFENDVMPSIQYLTENYRSDDPDLPKLHICFLDIETPHNDGFPNVTDTPAPIVLISVVDENAKTTVFGIGPYIKDQSDIEYINCINEPDLLTKFFNWMHQEQFDVITGWNIMADNKMNEYGGFDIPYIIRRSKKVFGKKGSNHTLLSPINIINEWKKNKGTEIIYYYDIAGVSIIDYMALYKWFTFNNLESFALDYVAEIELKKKKNDYSQYNTMYDFYKNDWDGFVDYCINDSNLVYKLEKKLGYINLAQMLTCYCGCQMKNYNSSVPLIEGLMLKYLRNNNMCAPRLDSGKQVWFPAAYVKTPVPGIYKDVVDLDIASSYPTHIIILNMSPETYFGRIIGFNKKDAANFYKNTGIHEPLHKGRPIYKKMVEYTRKKEFPDFFIIKDNKQQYYTGEKLKLFNTALKKKLLCIAPNGAVFKTNPKGVMATVEQTTFEERVKQKGLKAKYKNLVKSDLNNAEKWNEMSQNRHVLQWAIKIVLNSMFGILGVPYSRYFNTNIAEAITSCGRHTIQQCEVFTDELLNNPTSEIMDIVNEIKKITNNQ